MFLNSQANYQITRPLVHKTMKPIATTAPSKVWSVDLLDMNDIIGHNSKNRYIFVCVDVFSRMVWLERMTLKTSEQTASSLRDIIRRAGIQPDVITSDQGQEFQGSFAEFCKEHKIRQNLSRSYSPTENGLVERVNQDIRKILRAYFVENKSLRWSSILHEVENNKNET